MQKSVRLSLLIALSLLIGLTLTTASAQSTISRLEIDSASDGAFPNITFDITPVNDTGVPIPDLTKSDFTLLEDGNVVNDRFYSINQAESAEPVYIILVLDISGSMTDSLSDLKESAKTLLDNLRDQDQVALIGFNDLDDDPVTGGVDLSDPFPVLDPSREIGFTSDKNALRNFINLDLQISDDNAGTPLYDAIYKGVRMLDQEKSTFGRRAVIVLTDGVDMDRTGENAGSVFADEALVISEAQKRELPVFTVGLGDEIDEIALQKIASLSGGVYENRPDATEVGELFTNIATRLQQKYSVSYESQLESDDQKHQLVIQSGGAEESFTMTAFYPIEPRFLDIIATLPRQEPRTFESLPNVKGRVDIEVDIQARNAIEEVRYYINDATTEPVFIARDAPWTFEWDTTSLPANEEHTLIIEAVDDSSERNIGSRTLPPVLVEECNAICVFEQQTGVNPYYLLAGLVAALLLLILLLSRRSRRNAAPEPGGMYVPPVGGTMPGTEMPPTAFAPPPPLAEVPSTPMPNPSLNPGGGPSGAPNPTIRFGASIPNGDVSSNGDGTNGVRSSPKTEVLRLAPSKIAFLIDKQTGREFPLHPDTGVGRDANNDIVLDDGSVSGSHAKIKLEGDDFFVFDLASTNGTRVNGADIVRHNLVDGEVVEFGKLQLVFKEL